MESLTIDAEAGQGAAELALRGIPAKALVHVVIDLVEEGALPISLLAAAGGGFDWLANEPDLYRDADLIDPATPRTR